MKKSAFALIAFLALAGVTFGGVTLDYVVDETSTLAGYTAYIIQAKGIGVQNLAKFEIATPVYQHYAFTGSSTFDQTPWEVTNDLLDPGFYDKTNDSYVMFGDIRLPDLGGVIPLPGTFTPLPINTSEPNDGSAWEGVGSLSNYNTAGATPAWDAYLKTSAPDTTESTYNLFRLVLPNSVNIEEDGLDISVALYTATDYNATEKTWTVTEYARGYDETVEGVQELLWSWEEVEPEPTWLPGDCNKDGSVSLSDFQALGQNYGKVGGATWAQGDFNNDGNVSLSDFQALGQNYGVTYDPYAPTAASAVPEPGTVVMLILGALCLLGYRLRK